MLTKNKTLASPKQKKQKFCYIIYETPKVHGLTPIAVTFIRLLESKLKQLWNASIENVGYQLCSCPCRSIAA